MHSQLKIILALLVFIIIGSIPLSAQETIVKGTIKDSSGVAIVNAAIAVEELSSGTYTSSDGTFRLTLPSDGNIYTLLISNIGYKSVSKKVKSSGTQIYLSIILTQELIEIGDIPVIAQKNIPAAMMDVPVKDFRLLPSASGGVEAMLKTLPGVASNNELSSQYSVRGGNYDENLVYVNDIEIYRPFLIRSGQQEGLSFINPDMISSVTFSAGGFNSSFGDKLSSVLDVYYKNPTSLGGSVSLGLLTSSAHLEGISKDSRLSWMIGGRYKSTRLMLNTLDSRGEYQPVFGDIQSIITLRINEISTISLLSSYSSNRYNFIPESRSSTFGSEVEAYRLYVLFEGMERDHYNTWNSALTWEIRPKPDLKHKFILSSFGSDESESYDIKARYNLSNLDQNTGSENLTDSLLLIGLGGLHAHARNQLSATILSLGYMGDITFGNTSLSWGLKIRNDWFNDRIREWKMVDSAGYSIPYGTDGLHVSELIISKNNLSNQTVESYLESVKSYYSGVNRIRVSAGLRGTYYSFTGELLVSPRVSIRYRHRKNMEYWLASGLYFQPPFYREMRYPDGSINNAVKSQKSFHIIAGMSYDFISSGRPFRLSGEIYNKSLTSIIPYRMDNVRITYAGENIANGYSRGIDLRINGEFVEGAESWFSLSLMDSKLEIPSMIEGKFPAPNDQTVIVNIFFQDYLPGNPTWRAHININYSSGIPIVSPYNDRYDQYHRLPAYRRVDLGINKLIKAPEEERGKKILNTFSEIVAGVEIFNLLDINNTVSYYWVQTVNNLSGTSRIFAIPNYLTGRSLNIRISATF